MFLHQFGGITGLVWEKGIPVGGKQRGRVREKGGWVLSPMKIRFWGKKKREVG